MLRYRLPDIVQQCYRGVTWRRNPAEKAVYLTFDDGCIPEVTPRVLDMLDSFGVKATFFCVGDNVRKYPDLFTELKRRGHRVGNHTFHHLRGSRTSDAAYLADVQAAQELIPRTQAAQGPGIVPLQQAGQDPARQNQDQRGQDHQAGVDAALAKAPLFRGAFLFQPFK